MNVQQTERRDALAEERTRLAAERTFLAWLRTGMTSVGIGIALARFIIFREGVDQRLGHGIGQVLVLWGGAVFVFALLNYRKRMNLLPNYPGIPSFYGIALFTAVLVVVSLILLGIIVD